MFFYTDSVLRAITEKPVRRKTPHCTRMQPVKLLFRYQRPRPPENCFRIFRGTIFQYNGISR